MLLNPYRFGDPFRASVVAHLHFDGADESTTITDTTGRTWTASGNAKIDTDATAFEGVSLLLSATGDFVSTADAAELSIGGSDFTQEIVFQIDTGGRTNTLANKRDGGGAEEFTLVVGTDNTLTFAAFVSGSALTSLNSGPVTLSVGVRYTASISRISNDWYLHIDGVLVDSTTQSGSASGNGASLKVGRDGFNSGRDLFGRVDEYRFTNGVGRYNGSNYTPASGPFPNS